MLSPDITTSIRDRERGNVFHVLAYRKLRRHELEDAVATFYRQKGNARYLKKGRKERVVTIVTTYH